MDSVYGNKIWKQASCSSFQEHSLKDVVLSTLFCISSYAAGLERECDDSSSCLFGLCYTLEMAESGYLRASWNRASLLGLGDILPYCFLCEKNTTARQPPILFKLFCFWSFLLKAKLRPSSYIIHIDFPISVLLNSPDKSHFSFSTPATQQRN